MTANLPSIKWPTWTRNVQGDNFYDITQHVWSEGSGSNLSFAMNHPILTPAILFVSKIFSQADFQVKINGSNKIVESHWILNLLKNPNPYQTQEDFLETVMFMQIAQGVCVLYLKKIIGFDEPEHVYVLNYDLIEWPEEVKSGRTKIIGSGLLEKKIVYDRDGENLTIALKDLLFLYDLPNCVYKNPFKTKSRISGLRQTLVNTNDSLLAKNIILKTNGKELISGNKEGFPLTPDEKKEVEDLLQKNYGLGFKRKRGIVTKANIDWKSLHIALRDLGLDESVKVDGNLIYTALHIPKDILSLEAKKTTYNNFKESMVSYIQNEMQSSLNSLVATLNKLPIGDKYKLTGTYEHMPIMQYVLIERYEGINKRATALSNLLKAGVPQKDALEMVGMDPSIKLDLKMLQNGKQETTTDASNSTS